VKKALVITLSLVLFLGISFVAVSDDLESHDVWWDVTGGGSLGVNTESSYDTSANFVGEFEGWQDSSSDSSSSSNSNGYEYSSEYESSSFERHAEIENGMMEFVDDPADFEDTQIRTIVEAPGGSGSLDTSGSSSENFYEYESGNADYNHDYTSFSKSVELEASSFDGDPETSGFVALATGNDAYFGEEDGEAVGIRATASGSSEVSLDATATRYDYDYELGNGGDFDQSWDAGSISVEDWNE